MVKRIGGKPEARKHLENLSFAMLLAIIITEIRNRKKGKGSCSCHPQK